MDKQDLISYLLQQIEASDSVSGDHVIIGRQEALQIANLLAGHPAISVDARRTDGMKLFYCSDCAKSFWASAREDQDCFNRWHYHTWLAGCPDCGRQVTLNDRYWR